MKVINKHTGSEINFDANQLVGISTKSLYVRKGKMNGTLFLSQRGNGSDGAGDICRLDEEEITVNDNLFDRINIYVEKSKK